MNLGFEPNIMREKKTVFIMGAGSGCNVGMPTGTELKNDISNLITTNLTTEVFDTPQAPKSPFAQAIRLLAHKHGDYGTTINSFIDTGRQIVEALPAADSIDTFINDRKGDTDIALIGKNSIVNEILVRE